MLKSFFNAIGATAGVLVTVFAAAIGIPIVTYLAITLILSSVDDDRQRAREEHIQLLKQADMDVSMYLDSVSSESSRRVDQKSR